MGEGRDHVVEERRLAVETADGGRPAARGAALARGRGGEDLVEVEDGADVGIAWIAPALAGGIGDHGLDLGRDRFRGVRQEDGVAERLRHLAAVRARYLG